MYISVWGLKEVSSLSVLLLHYYLSPLTATWIWETWDKPYFLTVSNSQTHETKKEIKSLSKSTTVPLCISQRLSEAICSPSQSPRWGESGRHDSSQDTGQIPASWVWGMSIKECRSVTSMMFCRTSTCKRNAAEVWVPLISDYRCFPKCETMFGSNNETRSNCCSVVQGQQRVVLGTEQQHQENLSKGDACFTFTGSHSLYYRMGSIYPPFQAGINLISRYSQWLISIHYTRKLALITNC